MADVSDDADDLAVRLTPPSELDFGLASNLFVFLTKRFPSRGARNFLLPSAGCGNSGDRCLSVEPNTYTLIA